MLLLLPLLSLLPPPLRVTRLSSFAMVGRALLGCEYG